MDILGSLLGDVEKLPTEVATAISSTVGKMLNPTDTSLNPGDPQPSPAPIPVAAGSSGLDDAKKYIGVVVAVLNDVNKYAGSLIPEPYEGYINDLIEALSTVDGWL